MLRSLKDLERFTECATGSEVRSDLLVTEQWEEPAAGRSNESANLHPRGASEVKGHHIYRCTDAICHIDDFIVDDETWEVRYLVIDTHNRRFKKKVLVVPRWASCFSWEDRKLLANLSRDAIKNSPEWDVTLAIHPGPVSRRHAHYSRPLYWDSVSRPTPLPPPRRPSNRTG